MATARVARLPRLLLAASLAVCAAGLAGAGCDKERQGEESAANPDAVPDGTNGVIAKNLKEARTDGADVTRYCSP